MKSKYYSLFIGAMFVLGIHQHLANICLIFLKRVYLTTLLITRRMNKLKLLLMHSISNLNTCIIIMQC